MMAGEVNGIIASQRSTQEQATKSRNESKNLVKKLSLPMILLIAGVITFLFWWRSEGHEKVKTISASITQPSASQPGKVARQSVQTIQVFPARIINDEELPEVRSNTLYTMTLTPNAKILEGRAGFCLRWQSDLRDVDAVEVHVMGVDRHHGWMPYTKWKLRYEAQDPTLPFKGIAYYSFRTMGEPVEVRYEYLYAPTGRCPK